MHENEKGVLVIVPDCQHTRCKEVRLFDRWDLYIAPAVIMPDGSVAVSREDAEPMLRLVMN
jgi:hypothetical protein